MSGQELYLQREEIKKSLNRSMTKMHENGSEWAEKTRLYRIALSQKIMCLKDDGCQISIIDKVAKGDEEIAQKEFEMNLAEVSYKASQENIMVQKKLLDSIEEDIKREYTRRD